MSAVPAYSTRQSRRAELPTTQRLEVVATRAQRAARPRSFYAILAVASVFVLLLTQLLLSILLSDGAYQISSLQVEQNALSRSEQALSEQLSILGSPQNLAEQAESLGMVVGTGAPVFLRLSDGVVIGTVDAATGTIGALAASGGLVPNAALEAASINPLETEGSTTIDMAGGAPTALTASTSVASNDGTLPSPNTH